MATKKHKKTNKWLQGTAHKKGAISHPGALKRAAAAHGRSVKEEAEVESHSPNKHIRSRGILGKRLIGTAKHGNIRKHHGPRKHHGKRAASKA